MYMLGTNELYKMLAEAEDQMMTVAQVAERLEWDARRVRHAIEREFLRAYMSKLSGNYVIAKPEFDAFQRKVTAGEFSDWPEVDAAPDTDALVVPTNFRTR